MKKTLTLIAISTLLCSNINGDEEYNGPIVRRELSSTKRKMYLSDIERFKQKALRALEEAQDMTYLIPDMNAQETIHNLLGLS